MVRSLLTHGTAVLLTFGGIYLAISGTTPANDSQNITTLDLAIETASGSTLYLEVIEKSSATKVTVRNDSPAQMFVQFPTTFTLQSIYNAELDAISAPNNQNGFVRYALAPGVGITADAAHATESVLIHNIASVPLYIKYNRIQLPMSTINQNTQLVYGALARLW